MSKKFTANISITVVLVTTTILLLGGMAVIFSTMDLATSTKASSNKILNELRYQSCVEEGLYKLRLNNLFVGQITIPFTNGNCTADISIDPLDPDIRIFNITSLSNEFQFNIIKHVDISQNPFVIVD